VRALRFPIGRLISINDASCDRMQNARFSEVSAMGLLSYFARVSARMDLMNAMFRRLGVREWFANDPARAAVFRRAAMRCSACNHTAECREWLDRHEIAAHAPDFCRNHDLAERILQARQSTPG
jgi:hypothetical protein